MCPLLQNEEAAPSKKKKAFSKPLKIGLIAGATIILIGYAAAFAWAETYEGRLAPHLWIGQVKIGGQTTEEAKEAVNTAVDRLLLDGLQLSIDGKTKKIPLSSVGNEAGEYVVFDVNGALGAAARVHHSKFALLRPFILLFSLTHQSTVKIPVQIDENKLEAVVLDVFSESLQPAINAGFVFTQNEDGWQAAVTPSTKGLTVPTEEILSRCQEQLEFLDKRPLVLTRTEIVPTVLEANATKLLIAAEAVLTAAPYTLTFENKKWEVDTEILMAALQPSFDDKGEEVLDLSSEGLKPLLDKITAAIEKPAVNARLVMENERVTEFQGSSSGLTVDNEATIAALGQIIRTATEVKTVEVVTIITEPTVKMESVNNLGLKEILGTGTSNYKGSPTNRIKNIRNGARLLNGLLIKPGEEFSLLSALRPFDTDNGYLPELVIKGDKIEPETGGGLCQIGTTTFRAAMNSGLPITARSNHSLVVSYYNDPVNGNPGTDATIYDPVPDLKFINDTGNYLLFQAEMDEANTTLRFSFWGTSDGREGSYAPPTLIRWIPVGEEQKIETLDLEPGVEQCQSAHVGADATFTYTITRPDGTKEETVYDSHYRPLPKICLIGVEKLSEEPAEGEETEPGEAEAGPEEEGETTDGGTE
jgi:vancomycin resistance protein YoaR